MNEPELPPACHDDDGDKGVAEKSPEPLADSPEPEPDAVTARTVTASLEEPNDLVRRVDGPPFEVSAKWTLADTDWCSMSLPEASGVCLRQRAFSGVVSAHAGS
ncbi:hypothetical protein [Streptomyces sp. L2]|uniref:hypothetical protein n=1 Tax=Streptomyces sp. L2 TaxID=2162665 RepID=UPI001F512926|nr:hypothetical protein [Streptomyces sp. L2]